MQQNEDEDVIEGELLFTNDVAQFHISKKVQYTMPKIPKTKERHVGYKMPSIIVMELREAFTNRTMRQPNVRKRLSIRAEPSKVKLEGWGDNALKGTPIDL
jgi:hypothetical protein